MKDIVCVSGVELLMEYMEGALAMLRLTPRSRRCPPGDIECKTT